MLGYHSIIRIRLLALKYYDSITIGVRVWNLSLGVWECESLSLESESGVSVWSLSAEVLVWSLSLESESVI